ncbi:MAG TPA: NAD(P)/FAD-dependent oxidoreductase [Clostridiaceae bacterium]|jgi:predicted Rossmann fold flavoprotein|nr:NAD(P)/FAD-dependent oxidoreductase [Clostridiaceae bacterium]HOA31706.1 NAD(P)/FAD-dependent oxidoreductase [Clostridia bacterium]
MYDCIIIGAGAAGLFSALSASETGKRVLILEKNNIPGKKIRITGKGRCNITNSCSFDELIENIPGNGKFLYSSLSRFSNYDIIDTFNRLGLETVVERGNRVFPASNKSIDVVNVLVKELERRNVEIRYNSCVCKIVYENEYVKSVYVNDQFIETKNLIIATGGLSYPGTGSTGDGYRFAIEAGHTIVPTKPSLVPLVSSDQWIKELQGLSLKNIRLSLINKDGCFYSDFGEMLFTHNGISGPLVLTGSRHYISQQYKEIIASIDLKPALDEEKLDTRLLRDFEKYSRKQLKNAFNDLLPAKMIPVFVNRLDIDDNKTVNQITSYERKQILTLLKDFRINIISHGKMAEAVVTSGGVCTKEINPKTMESKIKKGLFFAGEVIDVDGYTGGFNLTVAFSTGYLAGKSLN